MKPNVVVDEMFPEGSLRLHHLFRLKMEISLSH